MHITDGNKRIAMIDSLTVDAGIILGTPTDTIRYQYDNHLGSASLELDENANTISYEEYQPFGTSSYRLHRNSTEASLKRYRYVGKERDEETGLYYYGARYYAAWIARFVSVDPLQHKYPELTPYQYASNNPTSDIDIDGLEGVKYAKRYVERKESLTTSSIKRPIAENQKEIEFEDDSFNAKSEVIENTIPAAGKATENVLENIAEKKIAYNKEQGIKVTNYGKTVQSPRKYKDADIKRLQGESEYIDMGWKETRGSVTTRGMGNETKGIKNLKLIGKGIGEAAGPIMDIYTLAKVLLGKETPFALINPVSFAVDEQLAQIDQTLFNAAVKEGYLATRDYIENCRSCQDQFENLSFLYVTEQEYLKIMGGEITSSKQLSNIERSEDLGHSVLIKSDGDEFIPMVGFANMKNK